MSQKILHQKIFEKRVKAYIRNLKKILIQKCVELNIEYKTRDTKKILAEKIVEKEISIELKNKNRGGRPKGSKKKNKKTIYDQTHRF